MLTSARKWASTRLKPIVGDRGWHILRKLDVHGEHERRRKALVAEISRQARERVEREHRKTARQTLSVLARGCRLTASQRLVLGELEAFLRAKPKAQVAIIGGSEAATLARLITRRFAGSTVVEIPGTATESERHVRLATTGPHHLILATGERDDPAELLTNVLFHLRRNGLLAITDLDHGQPAPAGLLPRLNRLTALRAQRGTPAYRVVDRDDRALVRGIRRVIVSDGYAVVENRTVASVKIREEETSLLLSLRGPSFGEVLEHHEAETFLPRCVVRDHIDGSGPGVLRATTPYEVPPLELREYSDVTCGLGQVVVKEHLLLPETYRHSQRPRLRSRKVEDLAPRFGRLRDDLTNRTEAAGAYFHWDSEYPGHFGHVLTEQLSRFWALDAARRRYPDLKVLFGRRHGHQSPMPFERTVLAAADVGEDEIWFNLRPVQVERLLAATPMLSMPEYVSPKIDAIWDVIGDRIAADAAEGPTPTRIFCSRRHAKRSCRNAPEVEQLFASHGFEVVFPEDLTMADQIAMFRSAEVVAGLAGSALFNLMFCPEPKPVIIVASEAYTATNEYLIGAVRQHSFDVFRSRPDEDAFQSSFRVDLEREGRLLARHLKALS